MLTFLLLSQTLAAPPRLLPAETAEAHRWALAKLAGQADSGAGRVGYVVQANHDPVLRNTRGGRPLTLAGRAFERGLYCHAQSRVEVHLPGPATRFTAVVGVDSNDQTSGGRGSVCFVVSAGGHELVRTPVLREGQPPVAVDVPLGGARDFLLEVTDGGDGISCDQADWADAQVTLADGTQLWLGDLQELTPDAALSADPPFSFLCDGQPSSALLPKWPVKRESQPLDDQRVRHTAVWTDPVSGLEVRCEGLEYRDYPTVEWTVWLRQTGPVESPLIEQLKALDGSFATPGGARLRHWAGSLCQANDYQPFVDPLPTNGSLHYAPRAGRGTDPVLPNFNLEADGQGLLVVVGWPGQWRCAFTQVGRAVKVVAGQELTRFRLRPGEQARTPLLVLQWYQGDPVRAQNVWRRWMLAHNLPRPGGQPVKPMLGACSSGQFGEMIHANEANQIQFVDRYAAERLPLDFWWMDAGWYPNKTGWPNTGTWEVDLGRFPRGLRAITDHAKTKGFRSIVWFEPERVTAGTWLAEHHPEWVLGGRQGGLLDLGNDEARAWLTDHVDGLLTSQGIDLYRQDFNMDPLDHWRLHDAPERQGLTENHHVVGYLAYWDELRRRRPNMLIDTCASGGRRNDLETLRRSVPLLRSDYLHEPHGQQQHTYGIASWIPYFGTGADVFSEYHYRSAMGPWMTIGPDMRVPVLPFDTARRLVGQWVGVRDLYLGDYYPLSGYDTTDQSWLAYQFDRPDLGRGLVQVFRRAGSPYETARYRLRGLDPAARYLVTDLDQPEQATVRGGQELLDGLAVTLTTRPRALLLTYRRLE